MAESKLIVATHQRGSTLRLNITISRFKDATDTNLTTEPINVDDLALVVAKCKNVNTEEIEVSVRMIKKENTRKCTARITCENFSKLICLSEEWGEIVILTKKYDAQGSLGPWIMYLYTTEVNITVQEETSMPMIVNKQLYEDTKSTDFQLHTADGTVAVHKAVLYIHSDMFRTMLGGEWKETEEGHVKVDGVTVQTLQHLKDYMYLGTLPDDGLEPLLLFAARYLMDKLEEDCIAKLIKTITPENFDGIVELASQNNMGQLVRALIMETPDDVGNKVHQLKINTKENGYSIMSVTAHHLESTWRLNISISKFSDAKTELSTDPINVDDLALVVVKCETKNHHEIEVSVRMIKNENIKRKFTVRITCENFSKPIRLSEEWVEFVLLTKKNDAQLSQRRVICGDYATRITHVYTMEVNITVHEETSMPMLIVSKRLYEDAKSTDFQLHTADGTMAVHKAVLFIHSNMFRTMLGGEWKEAEEGRVKVDGVTAQTLQHLKDYMYLGTLPDDGLEPLLLFAARYLMDKLKEDCIAKLIETITPENFDGIVELASQNNIGALVRALIMETPDDVVNKVHQFKKNMNKNDEK